MHYRSFNKAAYATLVVVLLLVAAAACAPDVTRLQRDGEVEKLIDALAYEKDAEVRADAAEALGELGDRPGGWSPGCPAALMQTRKFARKRWWLWAVLALPGDRASHCCIAR